MPYLKLSLRVLLIYFFTILIGTLIASFFMNKQGSIPTFKELFGVGFVVTGLCSLPNFIFLFFGIHLSYKKSRSKGQLNTNLFLLATLICFIPFSILVIIKALGINGFIFSIITDLSWGLLLMATPYIVSCYIFLFLVNYLLDKRFPLKTSNLRIKEDENLLDDYLTNEADI